MKKTVFYFCMLIIASVTYAQPRSRGFETGSGSAGSAGSAGSSSSSSSSATYWNNRSYKATGYMPMPEKTRKKTGPADTALKQTINRETIHRDKSINHDTAKNMAYNLNFSLNKRDSSAQEDTGIFIPASFPGGNNAFTRYVQKRAQIPSDCKSKGILKGAVILECMISASGSVAIVSSYNQNSGCGSLVYAAHRLIAESGNWQPATRNGVPVTSRLQVTVNFSKED